MKRGLLAFLAYGLLTIALTYPLVFQLGSAFPHDPVDPALNTWILWWNARTLPLTPAWWNAPAFYPVPGVLSFSENLLGLSLIATPVQWLGASPLQAYNLVFLLTFPLCAIGAYLLALEILKRRDAAFIAGLLFGFAPYRMAQLAHIQVLAAFGIPFALLGLHRYLVDPRPRWLALFGVAWFVQALCNGYYLLFFSAFVALWMLWFLPPLSRPRAFRAVLAAGTLAVLPLVPLLWQYKAIHERLGFVRDFGSVRHFGADALAFLMAAPSLAVWGWLDVYKRPEGELFPGLTVVLLVLASVVLLRRDAAGAGHGPASNKALRVTRSVLGVLLVGAAIVAMNVRIDDPWQVRLFGREWFSIGNPVKPLTWALAAAIVLVLTSARVRRAYAGRSVLGFYAVAAFIMWILSLGPAPTILGEPLMYRGPYVLLMELPGFNALRVPARFWMMSVLCLAMVGAIVFDRLGSRLARGRAVLAALVIVGVLADGWIWKFPLAPVPAAWKGQTCLPPENTGGAVMEIPLGNIVGDVGAMYRSIVHGRPTVNGYSGNFPPYYDALRFGLALRDPDVLTLLAAEHLEYVVIDREHPAERVFRKYVSTFPGAELVCSQEGHSVFRLPGSGRAATPVESPVTVPLKVASLAANVSGTLLNLMMDGDLTTRWETGPQEAGMVLEIDLGSSRAVSALELSLGGFSADFPRGLRIEASDDRIAWRELWRGTSAGRVMAAALRDPISLPVRYDLQGARARYLRLWLTEGDKTFYWSIAELKVLGLPRD